MELFIVTFNDKHQAFARVFDTAAAAADFKNLLLKKDFINHDEIETVETTLNEGWIHS
jgi:hypothetical protein